MIAAIAGEPSSSDGLNGIRPGRQDRQVGERPPAVSTSRFGRGVSLVSAVVRPVDGAEPEVLGEGRAAQVELDQHDAPPRQRDRVGEVDGDRRLALACDGTGQHQRVDVAGDGGEVERAAQDAERLEQLLALRRCPQPEAGLRDRAQHRQAVAALELLERLDAAVERLQQEHDREGECEPDQQAEDHGRREALADRLLPVPARPITLAPPPATARSPFRRCTYCSSAVRSLEPLGRPASCCCSLV